MKKPLTNYAVIDGQNLYFGIKGLGWKLDYKRLFVHLQETYGVKHAYIFLGYLDEQKPLYEYLSNCGFKIIFKEVAKDGDGKPKGNVDVDLTLHTVLKMDEYEKVILITSDGDFAPLVEYFLSEKKLRAVISPKRSLCSWLLRKYAKGKVDYLYKEKYVLEKKKKHP